MEYYNDAKSRQTSSKSDLYVNLLGEHKHKFLDKIFANQIQELYVQIAVAKILHKMPANQIK